jgi:outer membrane protein OmpA-like peptidoglycan-associated protein
MTFRSRLFATVALPVLSASMIATPALADALMKPFEVAQESTDEGQPADEQMLQQEEQQPSADDEAQRAAEEERQRQAEEQQAAEEADRAAAEQQAAEEDAQRAAAEEQKAAEEAERAAVEQQAAEEDAQRAAAEEQQRQAEEQKAAEEADRAAAEQKAAEDDAQRAAAEEQQRQADEQKAAAAAEEQQRQADEQKAAEDADKAAAEKQAADEAERAAEEQRQAEEPAPAEEQQAEQPADEQGEQPAVAGEETPAETGTEQPATAETGTEQPATAETGETPAAEPVPEVVDTLTNEEKQEIAKDPGQTDDTVVLPVENGAAVLDSDKDADNSGGQTSRDQRRKQREELRAQEEEALPESDDNAQAAVSEEVRQAVSSRIEAGNKEEGRRVKNAPEFEVPETTNIINNTVINNTIVNNNTTIDNSVTQVNVVERIENRTVLEVGDRLIVRSDDRPRLRRDSEEVYYDNLARGRVRETIVRPGGVQIVTIYNRYGDIIQRSRVGRDGREYILVYAPELEDDSPRPGLVDVGYELPPMRLRIPIEDYIIDTSSDPDRDYYDFLAEPPVERVERVYSIDEVKQSARLRDKVRRIDLDTITFATGSAEVPMSQARTLRSVAEAMQKVLDKDPGETFLIEGHTDAVGADRPNLVLSDERAESVASLLTEVYGVPPENLQTQGYGERFLKVRTQAAEQQNRRVTIRRVTTLVRPVASAN